MNGDANDLWREVNALKVSHAVIEEKLSTILREVQAIGHNQVTREACSEKHRGLVEKFDAHLDRTEKPNRALQFQVFGSILTGVTVAILVKVFGG